MTPGTDNENREYKDLIKSAIDKIDQAISTIFYTDHPEINRRLLKNLETIRDILKEVDSDIYKP